MVDRLLKRIGLMRISKIRYKPDLQEESAMNVGHPSPPPATAWECWVVHDYEKTVAVFPTEIEALRHAAAESYLKVKRARPGELWEQIR